tara:strand:+ start:9052 stop:10422 length:1371 start_codon:yes stop_codon:yes gene_type:complete
MANQFDDIDIFDTSQDVGSIEPIRPEPKGLMDLYLDYLQQDPLAQQVSGGDPLKKGLRFVSEFIPGVSTELARREGDKLGEALSYLDVIPATQAIPPAVKRAAVKKGIETITDATRREAEEFEDFKIQIADETNRKNPVFQQEIQTHPAVVRAQDRLLNERPTNTFENYGTEEFKQTRLFNFGDQQIQGYDNALENLYSRSRQLGWIDDGLEYGGRPRIEGEVKRAVIVLGPPASGKSSISNPIARKINATIIDPDEAKKTLPEYKGGLGTNAVHRESKEITAELRELVSMKGDNVVIPTVGDEVDKISDMVSYWKNKGYEVDLVDVVVPANEARARMLNRFSKTGRLIPFEYIDEVGDLPTQTYDIIKSQGIADGYTRIDNSVGYYDLKPIKEDTRGLAEGIEGFQLEEVVPKTRRYGGAINQSSRISEQSQPSLSKNQKSLNTFSPLQGGRKLI